MPIMADDMYLSLVGGTKQSADNLLNIQQIDGSNIL